MKLWVPATIIFLALTGLVWMGIVQGGIPELQVHQVLAGQCPEGEIKVHGIIHAIERKHRPLVFEIHDREDKTAILKIEVDDVRPDLFKVSNDVSVVGFYDSAAGMMRGEKINTKCPSKYEASKELQVPAESPPEKDAPEKGANP